MQDPETFPETTPDDLTVAGQVPASGTGDHPLTGDLADRFRIISLLGRGGMGEVYEAEDLTLGRRVALKAIRPERRLAPVARERFLREARLLSRLDHPGICRIYDLVEVKEHDFLVLELIEGRTLNEVADGLADKDRLELALNIAAVLEAAHAEGIVHRDLKPDNIMLTPDGQAKVLDFGLARDLAETTDPTLATIADEPLTSTDMTVDMSLAISSGGAILGTPAYLSPEQAHGEAATPASDMYGFGLVMQRLFTGQRPYEESEDVQAILELARQAHTRPVTGIDKDLAQLIVSLEGRTPAMRPTAAETRRRLAWIQRKPARRARRLTVAAAVALILVAGGKYMLDLRHERGIAERNRAEAEDLVEFMLGDLRDRLEPVGRLDVLDEVGNRALAYFAARSADERTPADHHRFARAMNQIGEVRLNQGDLDTAHDAFEKSRTAAASLVKHDPRQGEWLLTLGAAELWLGNVAYLQGDLDRAEEAFLAYRSVAQRLVALAPANEEWLAELGYAQTNLAALHEARNQMPEALLALDESVRIKRLILEASPEDPRRRSDLINALSWQGNVLLADGDLRAALARFSDGVAESEALVASDPGDMSHRAQLSVLLHTNATIAEWMGQDEKVDDLFLASFRISEKLVDHDPSNATWREGLASSHLAVGRRHRRSGRLVQATEHFLKAVTLADQLVLIEPDNLDFLENLAHAQRELARVAVVKRNLAEARDHVERALAPARVIQRAGEGDWESTTILAEILVLAGEIDQLDVRPEPAAAAWQEAFGLLAPVAEKCRASQTKEVWLRVLTYRGDTALAAQVAAELRAAGFMRRDFEQFCADHLILAQADLLSE